MSRGLTIIVVLLISQLLAVVMIYRGIVWWIAVPVSLLTGALTYIAFALVYYIGVQHGMSMRDD